MGSFEWLVFAVLMLGVGLGSAAAARALRPTAEEQEAWKSWEATRAVTTLRTVTTMDVARGSDWTSGVSVPAPRPDSD